MKGLKGLDFSNVFLASLFIEDRQCVHPECGHTLISLCVREPGLTVRWC